MNNVRLVQVAAADRGELVGAGFADAYAMIVDEVALDAPTAARRAFGRSPQWVRVLLRLRNGLVGMLGLKTATPNAERSEYGWFPVVSSSADRVVLGFDDKHLDFRLIASVVPHGKQTEVTVATIVRTHNLLGRCYLATIMPFHRVIVPAMLRQVTADKYSPSRSGT